MVYFPLLSVSLGRSLFIIWLAFVLCCGIRCERSRFQEYKY